MKNEFMHRLYLKLLGQINNKKKAYKKSSKALIEKFFSYK